MKFSDEQRRAWSIARTAPGTPPELYSDPRDTRTERKRKDKARERWRRKERLRTAAERAAHRAAACQMSDRRAADVRRLIATRKPGGAQEGEG